MCIWIDKNAYNEDCDDVKVYEYLYLLAYMLARKRRFFNHSYEYEDFAIYVASETLLRYRDERQFNENGRIRKIKT